MIPIGEREPQSRYIARVLREHGRISARECLYELADESGHKRSITRLAAIIEPLRKAGWEIETEGGHGELATYRVQHIPETPRPEPKRATWVCATCGADARMEPAPLLGGMGEAYCPACGKSRLFRRSSPITEPAGRQPMTGFGLPPARDRRAGAR